MLLRELSMLGVVVGEQSGFTGVNAIPSPTNEGLAGPAGSTLGATTDCKG